MYVWYPVTTYFFYYVVWVPIKIKKENTFYYWVINFKIKIEMFYNIERPVSFVNWGEKCNELLGAVV